VEGTVSDVVKERQTSHPAEPWLWRDDWAEGRALPFEKPGSATGSLTGYWIVAALALGGSFLIPRAAPAGEPFWPVGSVLWGLALLLGVFGFVAFYLAVKRTRAWRRFGDVWIALETNPAVLGGVLRAALQSANGFPDDARASLHLVCLLCARTRLYAAGRSYTTNLWEETTGAASGNGVIPFEFHLPADCPESDPDVPTDRAQWCQWSLGVSVKSRSGTFVNRFTLPVFSRKTLGTAVSP
jgi:hypothetical protein